MEGAPRKAAFHPARGCPGRQAARLLILAACLLALSGWGFPASAEPTGPDREVVVEAVPREPGGHTEGPLLVVPLPPGVPRIGIRFRHSVEQSPVVEWFEPMADCSAGFVLVATEYRSFGAGLPTEPPPGGRFSELPDRFIIDGLAVQVAELVLRPLPLTEHALLVGDAHYDLTNLAPPGAALRVRVRTVTDNAGDNSGP